MQIYGLLIFLGIFLTNFSYIFYSKIILKNNFMQNYILSNIRTCIPYIKELRNIAGSVTASILMQQLDYWFSKQGGEPFYKFKAPCEHSMYKKVQQSIDKNSKF